MEYQNIELGRSLSDLKLDFAASIYVDCSFFNNDRATLD